MILFSSQKVLNFSLEYCCAVSKHVSLEDKCYGVHTKLLQERSGMLCHKACSFGVQLRWACFTMCREVYIYFLELYSVV
jgi:hypothetical protein